MNRIFRLIWILLRSRWAARCPPLGPCRTRLRIWPNDLDVFLHVNNGAYLTLCDLGRVDLMLRSGTFGLAAGQGRIFLVAAETIQLHRPLGLFTRFDLHTRVIGWDDRAFYIEHRFTIPRRGPGPSGDGGDETVALAVVEGRAQDRKTGPVAPAEMLAGIGIEGESPPLPRWVERWRDDQRALRESTRGTRRPVAQGRER